MARILHLDTSDAATIVLFCDGGQILFSRHHAGERDSAAVINRIIAAALESSGAAMASIDAIAVCTGPGSYTGLRIALATAKGLAYALDKPIIAHNRLELGLLQIKELHPNAGTFLAILPARAGEYFVAIEGENIHVPSQLISTDALNAYLHAAKVSLPLAVWGVVGDDVSMPGEPETASYTARHPDDLVWAKAAQTSFNEKRLADLALLEPAYLKEVYFNAPKTRNSN